MRRNPGIKLFYRIIDSMDTPVPLYWMAPESYNELIFNEKTDVWSFGVCLYELYSLGEDPYENVKTLFDHLMEYLEKGNRLSKPKYIDSPEMYYYYSLLFLVSHSA